MLCLLDADPFLLEFGLYGRLGFSKESLSNIFTSYGVFEISLFAIYCIFYKAVWLRYAMFEKF